MVSLMALGQAAAAQEVVQKPVEQLQEVIVTAQKRGENVQKVPIAVSVVTSSRLEQIGAESVSDLTSLMPSVTFTSGNELRNDSIRIRGIGTDNFSVGVEPSTSTVVDGVVLQRGGAAFSDLEDIDRIEVLRGPQGTLFGKNSSAGAVNIVTKDPKFTVTEGSISSSYTTDGETRSNFVISTPLSDDLAFRLVGFIKYFPGNVKNLNSEHSGEMLNGGQSEGARLKTIWKQSDALELKFTTDYIVNHATAGALPLIVASQNPLAPITGTNVGVNNSEVNVDVSPYVIQHNYGYAFDAKLALGGYSLLWTSAFRGFKNEANSDLDNSQAKLVISNYSAEQSRTFTHEIRLVSPPSTLLDYVAGAFYFDGTVKQPMRRVGVNIGAVSAINPITGAITFRVPTDTYQDLWGENGPVTTLNTGLYSQGNYHITDKATFTLGARYIHEKQVADVNNEFVDYFNGTDKAPTVPFAGVYPALKSQKDAVIGKASIAYQFTPAIMGYASYSTGYKGVAWNISPSVGLAAWNAGPAAPETSRQEEIGLKARFFENRLQLNTAIFSTRINNYQGQTLNPVTQLSQLTSVGQVGLDGIEMEFEARPLQFLSVFGGATYNDARFTRGHVACYTGQPVGGSSACNFISGSSGPTLENVTSLPFPNAPKWKLSLGGRYERPVSNGLTGFLQANYTWQSAIVYDLSQNPIMDQSAYGILDLDAGVTTDSGYEFKVFVKNAGDQQYAADKISFNSSFIGTSYAQVIPRDFFRYAGVSLRYRF